MSVAILIASLVGSVVALNNGVGKLPKMGYDSIYVQLCTLSFY
jgi:hypothetical protein